MDQPDQATKERRLESNELEFAETVYIRDIENKVFQSLVLRTISSIEGVAFIEGGLIDNLLSMGNLDGIKGIFVEQDSNKNSVSVRVELNIGYGISIPVKAQEIQSNITKEITKYSGLHVSSVHVIFKNILSDKEMEKLRINPSLLSIPTPEEDGLDDDYPSEISS